MALKIAVIKENQANERRVAATPDTVKKLTALGCEVVIEKNAGANAHYLDADYKEAGAKITASYKDTVQSADIILCVQANDTLDFSAMKKGAMLAGLYNPYMNKDLVEKCAKANVTALSMELIPRISRAQSMDVLSSQSNLAGYKAVLDATEFYNRAMPMMMTAAGSIAPAKVFVMGAGVAGLQAIATARRLGAIVNATDVRPAAKEQVQSLGASFVAVENDEFIEAENAGGYAKEMSKDYQKQQAALVAETIAKQDIVITTALIPGRPAPQLITTKMVESMKPGSVIIDMAVEAGGNVEPSKTNEVVDVNGVKVVGYENIASRLSTDASALYAKNLFNLLSLIIKDKALAVDWDDEIVKGIALTKDGKVIHPNFASKKATSKKATKKAVKKTATKKAVKKSAKKTTKKTTAKKAPKKVIQKSSADLKLVKTDVKKEEL